MLSKPAKLFLAMCPVLGCAAAVFAQSPMPPDTTVDDAILDHMIAANVLTTPGAPPFHAVLEISSEAPLTAEDRGRIELFWAAPQSYSLKLDTPDFQQSLIVSGDKVQESDHGDFYPGWLQSFVSALLNPLARAKDLRGKPNLYFDDPHFADFCVKHFDRRDGLIDDLTFAEVCYNKALGTNLAFTMDFTHYLRVADFSPFHAKSIARTYHVSNRNFGKYQGSLKTLEDWQPDPARLTVADPTPPSGRILTILVSTATEESLLQSAAKDVHWPPVQEGKLEGYVTVHAITDRTGQVREASPYNTEDNNALAPATQQIALQYKFKPLLVDGVPQQMEMPLVLHFKTVAGEPIPEVGDAESRKLITGCVVPRGIVDPASAGKQIELILRVNADGRFVTVFSSDHKVSIPALINYFHPCHFAVYQQNGQPTAYNAHLSVLAK